jgi:hypothetical protein
VVLPYLLPHRTRQLSVPSVVDAKSSVAADDPHLGKLMRILDRQAAEPNRIEQLKDGRIGADSECQRGNRNQRETGIEAKLA